MPPMEKPPMAPDVQGQMAGPGFGAGVGAAQAQMGKSQTETAVSTVEKILMGVQDEKFKPYAMKAIAQLKVGLAVAQQQQPMSGQAPPAGGTPGGPQMPTPPTPGQMPA